jgi:hypothetical protein
MIYKNMELFNVSELSEGSMGGMRIHRFPISVEEEFGDQGKRMNRNATGVEIRFRMISDTVKLHLSAEGDGGIGSTFYRGSVLSKWQDLSRYISGGKGSVLVFEKADRPDLYKEITKSGNFPYSPEIIRLVISGGPLQIVGVEGEIEPPRKEDLPSRTYLAYGSSITHGSSALSVPYMFTTLVGERFNAQVRNLGMAGSALLEHGVADHIAEIGKKGEWDFATLCMGIDCLSRAEADIYESVGYMINTVADANPTKHIFCISPIFSSSDISGSESPKRWRRIIRELVEKRNSPYVHYVDGLSLMNGAWGLSGDFVHPAPVGVRAISKNLISEIEKYIF